MTTPTKTEEHITESWITENIYQVERIAWKYAGMLKHSDVEDLVQESLYEMLVTLRKNSDGIRSGGYLIKVAERAMLEYIRSGDDDMLGRRHNKSRHAEPYEDVWLFSVPLPGCDDQLAEDILESAPVLAVPELERKWLRSALSRLTEKRRVAVSMRYGLLGYGRYSESEATKALGIKKQAYEMRVTIARKDLRNDAMLAKAWKREQATKHRKVSNRHCLICKKHLRIKHQIGATGKTVFSGETFLCKICNMTYELNGYGCAVKRSKEVIVTPTGKAELESVLHLNSSVISACSHNSCTV